MEYSSNHKSHRVILPEKYQYLRILLISPCHIQDSASLRWHSFWRGLIRGKGILRADAIKRLTKRDRRHGFALHCATHQFLDNDFYDLRDLLRFHHLRFVLATLFLPITL